MKMEMAFLLAEYIAVMLLMILVGVILVKSKLLTQPQTKAFSTLSLYVCAPCLVLTAFHIEFTPEKLQGIGLAILCAVVIHIVFIAGAHVLFRGRTDKDIVDRVSSVYSNAGGITMPLISATLGPECLFYSVGYLVVQNILMWTHVVYSFSGDKKKMRPLKVLSNPNNVMGIIGFVLFISGLELPEIVQSTVDSFSNAAAPVLMVTMGIILGSTDWREIFLRRRNYLVCAARLLILPLLTLVVFKVLNMAQWVSTGKTVITVAMIAASAPVASNMTLFAQMFDKEPNYASSVGMNSTLLCIFTTPALIALTQWWL
ncbi:MAG: AEC family transporter [Eubacteriales bacterium]|jgi:predicted permease